MVSLVPYYLNNTETSINCYEYNKPIRSTILNFNTTVTDMDIDFNTPSSKFYSFVSPAGHVITGYLNIIPDS